ncbi:MAG: hypothetical protein JWQ40_4422 [Segetibacter sp.]|jgi:hypothetical protein|nr:hypothetical protein [Segetibacter sp.]
MLIKKRAFRCTIIVVLCLLIVLWLFNLAWSLPIKLLSGVILLISPLTNLYFELYLLKIKAKTILVNQSYSEQLFGWLLIITVILLTRSFNTSTIILALLLAVSGFLLKARRDLLFTHDIGYFKLTILHLAKVRWTEIQDISKEGSVLSITSTNAFLQINLSKMNMDDKSDLEHELHKNVTLKKDVGMASLQ